MCFCIIVFNVGATRSDSAIRAGSLRVPRDGRHRQNYDVGDNRDDGTDRILDNPRNYISHVLSPPAVRRRVECVTGTGDIRDTGSISC